MKRYLLSLPVFYPGYSPSLPVFHPRHQLTLPSLYPRKGRDLLSFQALYPRVRRYLPFETARVAMEAARARATLGFRDRSLTGVLPASAMLGGSKADAHLQQ